MQEEFENLFGDSDSDVDLSKRRKRKLLKVQQSLGLVASRDDGEDLQDVAIRGF